MIQWEAKYCDRSKNAKSERFMWNIGQTPVLFIPMTGAGHHS